MCVKTFKNGVKIVYVKKHYEKIAITEALNAISDTLYVMIKKFTRLDFNLIIIEHTIESIAGYIYFTFHYLFTQQGNVDVR